MNPNAKTKQISEPEPVETEVYEISEAEVEHDVVFENYIDPETGEIRVSELSAAKLKDIDLTIVDEFKLIGRCRYLRTLEARAMSVDETIAEIRDRMSKAMKPFNDEIERLGKRKATHLNKFESIKWLIRENLILSGKHKIDTGEFLVYIQKNPPSVEVSPEVDIEQLPPTFQKVKVEVDKAAIKEAWKASEEMPAGIIVKQGLSLRIK